MGRRVDSSQRWVPAKGVLSCTHGDVTAIVALSEGRYYTLDDSAGHIWTGISQGRNVEEVARDLAHRYGIKDPEVVLADVIEFVEALRSRCLIARYRRRFAPRTAEIPSPEIAHTHVTHRRRECTSLPSVLTCVAALGCMHACLKAFGLRRVMEAMPAVEREIAAPPNAENWMRRLVHNVKLANSIYPFEAACLEQSSVLLWFTRRNGIPTDLRIGVQPFPFAAHAWVEHKDRPVNETAEDLLKYRAFPVIEFAAD